MKEIKLLPIVDCDCININEGGTRWRSLSVIVDDMLSMVESVCRFDNGVGNGRNDDVDGKRLTFSFVTNGWSVEVVIVDRVYSF